MAAVASHSIAAERAERVLTAPRGRASQLAAGIAVSAGDWLWLLHADSRVDPAAWHALQGAVATPGACWGRFDVRLDGTDAAFRLIERLMNLRSRWTGICTGDQGIFVRRGALTAIGGMPQQALMEDIELSKRLKRVAPPLCIATPLTASARRWRGNGVVATVLLMWRLRLAYFFGASPAALARRYYGPHA